jgi:hypothetical protein
MNRCVVFALGLALVAAESAVADVGPLPVPEVLSLPALPAVPAAPTPTGVDQLPVPTLPPLVAPVRVVAPVPAAPTPSSGGTSAPSVSRAVPLGSGGRSTPNAAVRGRRTAEASPAGSGLRSPRRGARGRSGGAAVAAHERATSRGVRRRERRLRRTVRRHWACLDALPSLERRVLVLRSGLGPPRARTRAPVARALHLSTRQMGRVERRGLRRLRGLARGGCGDGQAMRPPTMSSEVPVDGPGRAAFAAATFEAGERALAGGGAGDRIEVKREQQSSAGPAQREPAPKLAPPAAAEPPAAVVNRARDSGGGTDLTVPLLALAMLLAVAVAVRDVVRTLRGDDLEPRPRKDWLG